MSANPIPDPQQSECKTRRTKPASQLLQRLDSTRVMHPFVLPQQSCVYVTHESVPFVQNETSVGEMTRCRDKVTHESVPFVQNETSVGGMTRCHDKVTLGMIIDLPRWRKYYVERQTQLTSRAIANRHARDVASAGRESSTNSHHDPKASVLGQGNFTFTELYHHMKSKYPFVPHCGKTSTLPQTLCSNPRQSKIRSLTSTLPQTLCSTPRQSKIRSLTSVYGVVRNANHRFDQKSRHSESARKLLIPYRYESVHDLVLI
jgi:hypothetical protein